MRFIKQKADNNLIKQKAYTFALRIIKLYKYLVENYHDYIISKQILRSGTSIGANVTEANRGESTPDFIHKLSIALKEAEETEYWLNLLVDSKYISDMQFDSIDKDCSDIIRILKKIIITTKSNKDKLK
jgi:four helix bundle protein